MAHTFNINTWEAEAGGQPGLHRVSFKTARVTQRNPISEKEKKERKERRKEGKRKKERERKGKERKGKERKGKVKTEQNKTKKQIRLTP